MNPSSRRFYKAVVEEALLGKDSDVAEDFNSGQFAMENTPSNQPGLGESGDDPSHWQPSLESPPRDATPDPRTTAEANTLEGKLCRRFVFISTDRKGSGTAASTCK